MPTILKDNRILGVDEARTEKGDLLMSVSAFEQLVSDDPVDAAHRVSADDSINVSATWRALSRPVLSDKAGDAWVLGTSAAERSAALESLQAPDFTLPDLNGRAHSLSDYRGKKVFLATWASW